MHAAPALTRQGLEQTRRELARLHPGTEADGLISACHPRAGVDLIYVGKGDAARLVLSLPWRGGGAPCGGGAIAKRGRVAMTVPYRQDDATAWATWIATCHIALELRQPWETMTDAQQQEFEDHGPVPCDGSFAPGPWCADCRFGEFEEE